ncbi:MAG TPA: AfsR/SARP family transcriptional regulator [Acidimicrobiia bacterium]|nr:AfsR/SARP family transcriptional regulator [Acidimicrobiia bacterium]
MRAGHVIRVLGPIDILTPQGPRDVGGKHQRTVLAALVLSVGRTVPADHLVDLVWGEEAPPSARTTLLSHISRLRNLIGQDGIVRRDHSYVLNVDAESVDALRFEKLLTQALDQRHEPEKCRVLCQQALSLWRGVPFGDLADDFPFRLEAIRLDEIRHSTMELRFESDLALGHHDLVVGALEAAIEESPYRERLWYLLIEALSMQERRVEALRVCQNFREALGEAGIEPRQRLADIEDNLLAG